MMMSGNTNRLNVHLLLACVLLCAMVVLGLGIASGADHEAVGRRLRAAVKAGELTAEQARAMMGVLRKDADIDAIGRKIRAAVQAGKITKEEGRAKMDAIRKKGAAKKEQKPDWDAIKRRIEGAVKSGKITRAEADAKYGEIKERMAERGQRGERRITREDYARVEAHLRKAAQEGKISEEDAKARLQGMRKMMAERGKRKREGEREGAARKDVDRGDVKKRIYREDFAAAADKIRKEIAEGKMSEEEGRARFAEMRKMIREKSERAARRDVDWDGIKRRIEGAVKSGKITRAEADAKYEEIKERMGKRRDKVHEGKELDYDAIGKRLKAAVEAGKLTEEEAKAEWVAIKKKAAAKDRMIRADDR